MNLGLQFQSIVWRNYLRVEKTRQPKASLFHIVIST